MSTVTLLVAVILTCSASVVSSITLRIVNGDPAGDGEFPGQVSLQYNRSHVCGASILDANWVLTVAQCVYGIHRDLIVLVAGTNDLREGGTLHRAVKVIMHERYIVDDSWINDIALIKVDTPFVFTEPKVRQVKLPNENQVFPVDSPATVVGWGRTSYNGNDSSILRKINLVVEEHERCTVMYSSQGLDVHVSNICAGTFVEGGRGFCEGDAGAPLYVDGQVVGLASFNIECGTIATYPDVFTRVAFYRRWIKDQTGV